MPEPGLMALAVVEDLDELEEVEPGGVSGLEVDAAADPGDLALEGGPKVSMAALSQQSPVEPKLTFEAARLAIEQKSPET
jgi:hypothetical protein